MKPGYERELYYPDLTLRGFIESYSILTPSFCRISTIPWHIMPDGAAYILLHVYQSEGHTSFYSKLAFVGPRSRFILTDRKQRILSLIAQLKPGTAFLPLSCPLVELKDRSYVLDDFLGLNLYEAKEELTNLAAASRIKELVERFDQLMMSLWNPKIEQSNLAKAAIRSIHEADGQIAVQALSDKMGVSDRHLRSVFRKVIGLSPKRYARIVRLTETVRAIDRGYAYGSAQLAIARGYYDQSHMIDDFQELVGESPDVFIARSNRENVLTSTSDFSNT